MTVFTRLTYRLVALTLLGAAPLAHAQAATTTIQASANVVKSLTLTAKQNLEFGTIMPSGAPGTTTVSISMAGALTCPGGVTCSGAVRPAILNVTGTNGQVVQIFVVASDLVNASDGTRLRFTPVAPASVTLTNSGNPGKDFNVGGSIAIPSTATEGVYTGPVQVTIDYQ